MTMEPGWYFARRKTWAIGSQRDLVVVKVTNWGGGGVVVWQFADPEPHMTDEYDFGRRVYPELENHT